MGDYKPDPNNPGKQIPNTTYSAGDGTAIVRKYAAAGDLPSTNVGTGTMALVGDTKLYVYNGSAWKSVTLS